MKRVEVIILMMASVFLMSSCSQSEDYYSLNDVYLSLGMVDTDNALGYDFVLYCDNGDTLLPAVNDVSYFDAYNNQRVLINYTILGEVDATSTQKLYVRINNMQEVLYKDLIELTSENADSLGHDSVTISNLWIVNDMMNIEFSYLGGIEKHYINLAYTTNANGELEEPVVLQFKHNANKDKANILFNGIVTFKLDRLKFKGQDSVSYIVKSTGLLNGDQSFDGTYTY